MTTSAGRGRRAAPRCLTEPSETPYLLDVDLAFARRYEEASEMGTWVPAPFARTFDALLADRNAARYAEQDLCIGTSAASDAAAVVRSTIDYARASRGTAAPDRGQGKGLPRPG